MLRSFLLRSTTEQIRFISYCLLAFLLLAPTIHNVCAQAPGWAGAFTGSSTQANGTSVVSSIAADAQGNVFVTGSFTGQVYFGNTLLTSRGGSDLFVAKYVLSTSTWAWATSGGGTGVDGGNDIAVSGNNVYVAVRFDNSRSNSNGVLFGGTGTTMGTVQVNGATATTSADLLLVKYTDNGSTAALVWTQVAGGSNTDYAIGVAVSGSSVYLTGSIRNDTGNSQGVLFGGTGTTAGTVPQAGATGPVTTDLVLAKYTDNGSSATLGWTQVGGGTDSDTGLDVAVSGNKIYVAGFFNNTASNASGVLFGGTGTTAGTVQVNGVSNTSSFDLLLVKYTDNGSSATLNWTQVGGGTEFDAGYGVAVSGSSVYVVGDITNTTSNASRVLFGGTGTTAGTVQVNGASSVAYPDIVLAKYTDNGNTATLGWTQVGGGTDPDEGYRVAVSGTSVYMTGHVFNTTNNASGVLFGGTGTTAGTVQVNGASSTASPDLVLAKYTDNGSSATLNWTQVGGGTGRDVGAGIALNGQNVLVAGSVVPSASFGSYVIIGPASVTTVLARVLDTSLMPLAVHPVGASNAGLVLFPNPAHPSGAVMLGGAAPGMAVQVLDALSRVVTTATTDAAGTAALGGLVSGLYLVRVGGSSVRLAVE